MNIRLVLLTACLLGAGCLTAQLRLFVAGNLADAEPAFYPALAHQLQQSNEKTAVLLPGDMIKSCTEGILDYKKNDEDGDRAFASLKPLLRLIREMPEVDFYFVPGDRDWDFSGENGLDCVKALEDFLNDQELPNLHWPLRNGCPGPEIVNLSPRVMLMLINTQWWNHPFEKPVPADSDCPFADASIAYDLMESTIDENQDRNVIIAGHYPPKSQGRHGGNFPGRDHFVPPVLGSFNLSYHQNVGSPQDLANKRFQPLASKLKGYNGFFEGLIFVGAQDRSQQLLKFRNNFILNAGAAGKGRWVAKYKPAMHVSRKAGFTELRFQEDGRVDYSYLHLDTDLPPVVHPIYRSPCNETDTGVPINPAVPPCLIGEDSLGAYPRLGVDSVTLAAGPQYQRRGFGRTFLGSHYRDTWAEAVKVPVLDITKDMGGLTPVREGGGRQTSSLVLQKTNGEQYIFRSVDKDPAGTFDFELRKTIIGDAVRDQTSSGHPYGNLVVAPLLEKIGILHASPRLFLMSPGPALGSFNPTFGNLLGTLEIRPRKPDPEQDMEGTFGASDIYKSYELFRERYDDQEVRIEFAEFLRARLFDLLIGDWSRHEDNWKWAVYRGTDGVEYARPIPRDRDNAFSRMDGFFPWLASRRWGVPNLENFGYKEPDIRSLTYQARHMDRLLLASLSREDFLQQARTIQEVLTDEVLAEAIRQMPPEVQDISGPEMLAKLQRRRNDLQHYAEEYYLLLARRVDVVGTNDEEAFLALRGADESLTITITDLKGKSKGKILYHRRFEAGETEEVCLYGLADDDQFILRGPTSGKIRLRIIGGPGRDQLVNETTGGGSQRTYFYEKSDALAEQDPGPGVQLVDNWREELYYYDRTAFKYNTTVPQAGVGFNSFNGFQLGLGFVHTRRNFTRRDYSVRYKGYLEGSTLGNAVAIGSVEFAEVFRKIDVVLATRLGRPDFLNYFFGLGNQSVKDPTLDRDEFYLVQLQHFSVEGGLRRIFFGRSYVHLMTGYQSNRTIATENTILDTDERLYGVGDLVFGYVKPEIVIDLRDNTGLPSKGILFEASQKFAIGKGVPKFGISKVAAEIHLSTRRFPISFSMRGGYATSQGQAPFYELPSLGRSNGLRGFQRNRFVGEGYVFFNTEFRSPVALIHSRIIPFAIGIRAFYDRGKILQGGEDGGGFKSAYGGGLYLIPLAKTYTVSVLAGFSDEEKGIVQFSAGTNF